MLRYRRNINCLTSDQLHDLREALAILYELPAESPHSYLHVGGIHGMPAPAWCIHGAPGFLTWHRAYLLEFEKALHCINPGVQVPYWNWSSGPTTGVPAPCALPTYVNRDDDTVPNPLYAGPLPSGGPGTETSRRSDIDTTSFADLATTAQNTMAELDFNSFQNALNGVHGSVHGRVGGDMSSVPYAGFDPIFHLHHANVDRLWANWQITRAVSLPPEEAGLALEPFVKPCSNDYYVGADMESTQALGYAYANFCLIIVGPIVVFEAIPLRIEPWMRERLEGAKLVIRSSEMHEQTFELRVFVNEPEANVETPFLEHEAYAGSFGIFGLGKMKHGERDAGHGARQPAPPTREERFDLELEITDALRTALKKRTEPTITLVPVDTDGRRVEPRQIHLEQLELHVR